MSEANTVLNNKGEIVGIGKFGVGWLSKPRQKLGEYDKNFVYTNSGRTIASFADGIVLDMENQEIGRYENFQLTIKNKVIGKCIGCDGMAALSITFAAEYKLI